MPIYHNGNKITEIMRNEKEISKAYHNELLVYQNKVAPGTVIWDENRYFASFAPFTYNFPILKNTGEFVDGFDINKLKTGIKMISNGYTIADNVGYDTPSYPGYDNKFGATIVSKITKEQLLAKEKVQLTYNASIHEYKLYFQMMENNSFKILSDGYDNQSSMIEYAQNNTYPGYYYEVIEKIIAY